MRRFGWRELFLGVAILLFGSAISPPLRGVEPISVSRSNLLADLGLETATLAPWQEALASDLVYLASDELAGRSAVAESIDQAAEYIAKRFREVGLETSLYGESPFQPVEIPVEPQAGAADKNRLTLQLSQPTSSRVDTALGVTMNPLAIGSGSAKAQGRVIFAGYGITAPEFSYDDYAGLDVRGAIVVVLRKEPGQQAANSRFDGQRTTSHAYFQTKVANAISHGAAAVVLVNDRLTVQQTLAQHQSAIAREQGRRDAVLQQIAQLPEEATNSRRTLQRKVSEIDGIIQGYNSETVRISNGLIGISEAGSKPVEDARIPVVSLARGVIDELLEKQLGQTLEDIERRIDATETPSSFELSGLEGDIEVDLRSGTRTSNNVLAVLPGRGPLADETIVIGAHYDHVGMGGFGSLAPGTIAIHNGADDNASGTASIIACAELLKQRLGSFDTHRRVLFIAFTGEERGLLGSAHYVRSPRFPLNSTAAMLNLDMVGRLRDNELTVYGTGSGDSLDRIVEQANGKHKFQLFKVVSGYGPSDHQSFYEAGIPVLFFFTGLHSDYHRPSDDFDKIDFGGLFRITDMVCDVASQLAVQPSRPLRVETNKGVQIRRQLTAFLGVTLSTEGNSVVLSGIVTGGPAEQSGLVMGDQLEKLGETPVRSAADVLDWLRFRSPGETITVTYRRAGQVLEKQVRLQSRPEGP